MTKDEFEKLRLEQRSKRLKAELTKLEEQLSALKPYVEKYNRVADLLQSLSGNIKRDYKVFGA